MEMISIKILLNQMNIVSDLVIRPAHMYCPPHTKRRNRTELNCAVLPVVRSDHELFLLRFKFRIADQSLCLVCTVLPLARNMLFIRNKSNMHSQSNVSEPNMNDFEGF